MHFFFVGCLIWETGKQDTELKSLRSLDISRPSLEEIYFSRRSQELFQRFGTPRSLTGLLVTWGLGCAFLGMNLTYLVVDKINPHYARPWRTRI